MLEVCLCLFIYLYLFFFICIIFIYFFFYKRERATSGVLRKNRDNEPQSAEENSIALWLIVLN